jgi:hypothetical protein
MPRSLEDVIEDAEQLEKETRKHLERAERLVNELYVFERAYAENNPAQAKRRRGPQTHAAAGPPPVAHDLGLARMEGGGAAVTIDGGKRIALPPTLAELIAILAADEGESPDELVAWKSFDRVCELLEKRLGRKYDHHAVSQLLWRLREALEAVNYDRRLVESAPAVGARLRLKRRPSAGALCAG